jgi:hypothetical protein
MTTYHSSFSFVAGDDWEIKAQLVDDQGAPYNLSGGQQIKWTLLDPKYKRVIDTPDVGISIVDAVQGKISILIPATKTTALASELYTDALRLIAGGIASTLMYGPIYVMADPWAVVQSMLNAQAPLARRKPNLSVVQVDVPVPVKPAA